jgi:hypothetical protein
MYCGFRDLSRLSAFSSLKKLVVDNNDLEEKVLDSLPKMPTLDTLWLNNNSFIDLAVVLEVLSSKCPNLRVFSMMRNPACPDPFFSQSEVSELLYQRYRLAVIKAFPLLNFLDASPVTAQEKKAAQEEDLPSSPKSPRGYHIAARPVEQECLSPKGSAADEQNSGIGLDRPNENRKRRTGAFMNKAKVRYDGTNSEGNRFIKNRDL